MLWLWLLIALTLITLIGHGIWSIVAFTLRAIFNLHEPEAKAACPHCGRQTALRRPSCEWCGRSRQTGAPTETDDLAAVERQLERWRSGGQLSPAEAGRFMTRVKAYRQSLARVPSSPPAVAPAQSELVALLMKLGELAPREQQRVLEIYDRMTPAQRAALALSAQINLARLLARFGRIDDALSIYRRVTEIHTNDLGKGRMALEAVRLAVQGQRRDAAASFLALLDRLDLAQLQAEKEQLAGALRAASTVKISEPVTAEIVEAAAVIPARSSGAVPSAGISARPVFAVDSAAAQNRLSHRESTPAGEAKDEHRRQEPPAPRRSLAEVLSTFMEDRNIRWGELVGGLLIVCSSVALVISLWETLKTIPYFQFFIFVGVSAALFGVGLYTEHRWKLASTSRGILTISTLLVPLNFVAMAGTAREHWDVVAAITQLAALAIFTLLVRQAGRVLVDGWQTWLTLGVVGGSGVLLAVPHQPALGWAMMLSTPAIALAAFGVGRAITDLARRQQAAAGDANRLFLLLSCLMFTVVVTLGLVVARSADRSAALNVLSPLIAAGGTLAAICGLFVMRAMADENQAGLRTSGTAVGLLGAAVMLAATGLAWPLPAAMIAVGLFNFAVLAFCAARFRVTALHAVAIACLALAYATGTHVALGHLPAMERIQPSLALLRWFASAQTGTSLVGLFVGLFIAAELLARRGRMNDALVYVGGCAVVAVISLSLVSVRGYLSGHADAWRAALVFAVYGLGCLAMNARWRRPIATHSGAALMGGALAYAIAFTGTFEVPYRWIVIALAQATWTTIASVLIDLQRAAAPALVAGNAPSVLSDGDAETAGHKARSNLDDLALENSMAAAFGEPLRQWGVGASLIVVVAFAWIDWQRPLMLSLDLAWLAAIWLVLAFAERSPRWFTAFQTAVYAAAAFAVTAWLKEQPWVIGNPRGLLHPRSLQVYGIGCGLIGLFWTMLRVALRRRPWFADLSPVGVVGVDRLIRYGLVITSFAMAAAGTLPGIEAEFLGNWQLRAMAGVPVWLMQDHAYEAFGWMLVGVLATGTIAALWDRWGRADLMASVLLLVNIAVLVAGPASANWAIASALRWSLAAAFVSGSLAVWFRRPLARIAERGQCRIDVGEHAAGLAAGWLIALAALPVVGFSGLVAGMRILGEAPAGPLPGIWLAQVGFSVSHLVPLALVVLGLAGYAVREASPGYTFAAGVVANLTVTGGYALNLPQFGASEAARLVQLAAITAAIWTIGWLAARRRALALAGRSESPSSWPLLRLQWAQSALGNLLLLAPAFALVAIDSSLGMGSGVHDWIAAVGSPLGWFTLAVVCATGRLLGWQRGRPLRPEAIGLMGMTALGLVACSVEAVLPGTPWAFRTLMLGWASYALSVVAATWWATAVYAPAASEGPPEVLVRAAGVWVRVAGLLALSLGVKAVLVGGGDASEPLWGAAAIGIASAAAAAMAVWQRREGWAFIAGLGINLASTIVVWHRLTIGHRLVADEWLWLLQANLIAAGVVGLLWLAARRRLYSVRELRIGVSPFLTVQIAAIAVGNALLLAFALVELLVRPGSMSEALRQHASSAGWFAWLAGSAAIAIYLYHIARRELIHLVASALLGAGVLAAISIGQADATWQSYHWLIACWASVAVAMLAASWLASHAANQELPAGPSAVWLAVKRVLPGGEVEVWATAISVALAALAIRAAATDPARPWWPMAAAVAAAGISAALGLWRRNSQHAYRSGMFACLAISLFWCAQENAGGGDLLLLNAIALAVTGSFWSLVARWTKPLDPAAASETLPPFEHAAVAIAVGLISAVAWLAWCASWLSSELAMTALRFNCDVRLSWAAWAAVVAALAIARGDHRATFWPAGFYAAGLAAIAWALGQQRWSGGELLWATGPALAGWMLAAAVVELVANGRSDKREGSRGWFFAAQVTIAAVATLLSAWTAVAFETHFDRAAGGVSALLLLFASGCMLRGAGDRRLQFWHMAMLALAVLAPAECIWVFCDGPSPAIRWIHRETALLASLALSIAGCEWLAPRLLAGGSPQAAHDGVLSRSGRRQNAWRQSVRRWLPIAIGLSLAILAMVLVQERSQYVPREGVAMALVAKLAIVAMLTGLALLAVMYAVVERRDPLRLSPRGRTAYVYAAEALAVLVCVHVRTTMPKLIPFGTIENWWTLIVMIVAFCGAGFAEFFQRRRLSVLAEPLARTAMLAPLLPAAAPLAGLVWLPDELHVWMIQARLFSNEAVLFLVAAFYGIQAATVRSPSSPLVPRDNVLSPSDGRQRAAMQSLMFAALAVVSGNAGLWLLWQRLHIEFLVHPQLWLIPPALAALVAEYLNRDRLKPEQSGAVRYLALSTIYVASTADVFMSHVDRHISLPLVLVLLALSVVGILSGMLLRIRSFLYLGFTFLLVDLSVMVYHASWDLGHTWVFWSTGIAVGLAILALFAVFEKRRNEMVLALERLKDWR